MNIKELLETLGKIAKAEHNICTICRYHEHREPHDTYPFVYTLCNYDKECWFNVKVNEICQRELKKIKNTTSET